MLIDADGMVGTDDEDGGAPVVFSDQDFLDIVGEARRTSIGFGMESDELASSRARAIEYFKGEMDDIPSLPNRSKAVSTDVADAIETILPDLIEIFTTEDDVVAFAPQTPDDEDAAQQETDYLNHVVYHDNPGFMTLYTMFKDALLEKTGVVTWWYEDDCYEEEHFEGKVLSELLMATRDGEVLDRRVDNQDEIDAALIAQQSVMPEVPDPSAPTLPPPSIPEPTFSFTVKRIVARGRAKLRPVAPNDFAIAPDAIDIATATYCAMRARPRAQDLIAEGIDEDIVAELPEYADGRDNTEEQARDRANETNKLPITGSDNLHSVEVTTHYIRVDSDGDGEPELWRVRTGGSDAILIDREQVDGLPPFAAVTPFIVTHRFYGDSVADKLIEIQRIKTALMRMMLDSGYFALNQRLEVSEADANEFTISDLLRNEPGLPIRSATGNAIKAIGSQGLSFDTFGALEYFSTVAEQRSGVVRNAQGLNPDTLHDTAQGAQALMSAAQRRIRLIARIFAETGVKDMFLGVHRLIRENATASQKARLNGKWVDVDPTTWAERNDMVIEVGLGASGKQEEVANLTRLASMQAQIVASQGGLNGPLVKANNAYETLLRLTAKMGLKAPEKYWSDPSTAEPEQPPPSPDAIKAQAEMAKTQAQMERDKIKAENDLTIEREKMQMNMALKRDEMEQEAQLERERMQMEFNLKAAQAIGNAGAQSTTIAQANLRSPV